MASGCKSAIGCVDARIPVRATYVNLYKWPESDAEFVRSVVIGEKNSRKWGPNPRVVDSYSCRQMYLRSYTFSKKESMPEKTVKCFGRVKEKAADLPFVSHQRRDSSSASVSSFDGGSVKSSKRRNSSSTGRKSKNMKKKSCITVKKLREVSCTAISSIFCRLLSCTASVDVVDIDRRARP